MDYQPSDKLKAIVEKVEVLRTAATTQAEAEMTGLLKQIKRLYPHTTVRWRSGMGSCSISFSPVIEIDGGEHEIDDLIGEVTANEWRIARGDERAQGLLGLAEQVFAIHGYLVSEFQTEVDQAKA